MVIIILTAQRCNPYDTMCTVRFVNPAPRSVRLIYHDFILVAVGGGTPLCEFDGHLEVFPYLLRLVYCHYIYRESPVCTLFRLVLRIPTVPALWISTFRISYATDGAF